MRWLLRRLAVCQWSPSGGCAPNEFWDQATATEMLPFLGEVTALAGRARQAGERLSCWLCL
jgi:hypothetical protein